MKKGIFVLLSFLTFISFSCNGPITKQENLLDSTVAQGNLRIFYAGSMIVPMPQIIKSFEAEYPHVNVLAEPSGSREAARKVIDKNKKCDILISSDYRVIKNLMIPKYANWYIEFATNEMVIAYTKSSHLQNQISADNWYKILMNDSVHYGRANPDNDPCGHRTVISIKLAEKYYNEYGIKDILLFKDKEFITSSDHNLIELLQKKKIDYAFIYKSVAVQKGFDFLALPQQINLGSSKFKSYYAQADTKVSSNSPGKYIRLKGDPIQYALTQINNAPNPVAAEAFLKFFLNKKKGMEILRANKMSVLDSLIIIPEDSTTIAIRQQLSL